MWKARDLTGERFGKLTAISRAENTSAGKAQWLCRCECGNTTIKRSSSLVRGQVISCGCYTRAKNLLGKRFGRLTAIEIVGRSADKRALWKCKCDCGNETITNSHLLLAGDTISCGCKSRKHGMTNTRIHKIWSGMLERCQNPNNKDYKNYGTRGISVCQEWQSDFLSFYTWALTNGYATDLTIDRKDNNGNYEPENCRWATHKQQANNKRTNHRLEFLGEVMNLGEWADLIGIGRSTLHYRISNGWPIESALKNQTLKQEGNNG